jgi:uncharacterized protein YvpB
MIAVERPPVENPTQAPRAPVARRSWGRRWSRSLSAAVLILCLVGSLGGGGLIDVGSAYSLQGRATALEARWEWMVDNGVPDSDLAPLRREWSQSQATLLLGAGAMFWLPGGAATLNRWESESDAIWSRDLGRYRTDALTAEQALHDALAPESLVQRKARLEAFAEASTPLEFSTLRDGWLTEARLVPVDRRIAAQVAIVGGQVNKANKMGIRTEPALDVIARADAYTRLLPQERMARAEMLTRAVVALQTNLQGRLDAAAVAQQGFQKANNEIALAQLYGLDTTRLTARVATDQVLFGAATTPAAFNAVTQDLKDVASSADRAVYVALSQTHVIPGITFVYQNHPLSCEEASTSMALTHQGIHVSQDQILAEVGADLRPMYVDAAGRVRWGNAYRTFVGNVNGSESNYTGLGTFWPPLVRVARNHGARILAYGAMNAATIYARVIAGHPVVAFATWDWAWHPRRDYLSFDGQWIPWIGPVFASHVYVVAGVGPTRVLVNDPIRGQYWISKAAFEAGYSDFGEAIVFA